MRTFLALILCSLFSISIHARQLSEREALQRASEFLSHSQGRKAPKLDMPGLKLSYVAKEKTSTYYYVFNKDNGNGFVIASADDRISPVLGYSDSGNLDMNNLPPNVKYWMDEYSRQIEWVYAHPQDYTTVYKASSRTTYPEIEPLVTTRWNQRKPYNNMCPMDGDSRSLTGCVATAMAQIMNFHQCPDVASGSVDYITRSKNIPVSATLEGTVYDWDNMRDKYIDREYTQEESDAVAKLMFHCGASVDMDYTSSASSAPSSSVTSALTSHFGYDSNTVQIIDCDYFLSEEIDSYITEELSNDRPIYFSGSNENTGHTFILDGLNSEGMVHINWGWGGLADGFYIRTALKPESPGAIISGGGYNYNQALIIGIQKAGTSTNPIKLNTYIGGWGDLLYKDNHFTTEGTFFTDFFIKNSPEGGTDIFEGLLFTTLDESNSFILSKTDAEYYHEGNYGFEAFQEPFDYSQIPDGIYTVKLIYRLSNEEEFSNVRFPSESRDYLYAKKNFGTVEYDTKNNFDDIIGTDISEIKFNISKPYLHIGETLTIVTEITPENATNKTLKWESSDPNIASVDNDGKVMGIRNGSTTITATAANGISTSIRITVGEAPTSLSLIFKELSFYKGSPKRGIGAKSYPTEFSQDYFEWESSNENIATVDETGYVTPVGGGETDIIVRTPNGLSEKCHIHVFEYPTTLKLEYDFLEVNVGGLEPIAATIYPEHADTYLFWESSDEEVATVSAGGVFGKKIGSCVVTATTSNGISASCNVAVIEPVLQISISENYIELDEGEMFYLTAEVEPEDATHKELSWSSSDNSIATVDENGTITAIHAGTAYIVATASNGVSSYCIVLVKESVIIQPVRELILSETNIELDKGEMFTLTATVMPEDAADKSISWSSSNNSIATVDENGTITAINTGEAIITVTASNGVSASCTVNVTQPVEGIVLSFSELEINVGDEFTLNATIYPEDTSEDKTLIWTS